MNEKEKGIISVSVKDIIIAVLMVVLVFWVAFEIFKIKHQMNFAVTVEQAKQNTIWIQNFRQSVANAQQQQRALQQQTPAQPVKPPEEPPEKK